MAKSSVSQWDTTADNNTDIGGISLAENVMAPPAVNNAIREMMAQLADLYADIQLKAVGQVAYFALSAAPDGWLAADGKTIGNGSSGGTARANADMSALFVALWDSHSNTLLPIQDSTGTATARGATAAADFAANKRLPLPDYRGEFLRGLDSGRGVDASRTLGSAQSDAFKSHTHTPTVTDPGHAHNVDARITTTGPGLGTGGNFVPNQTTTTETSKTGITVSIANTGGTETRPRNIALLACIKY